MSARLKGIFALILRPLQAAAYLLSGFMPRDLRRWSFGCWSGHRFGDNAGAVFEFLNENPTAGVRAAWITNERTIRDELRARGLRSYLAWSPGGVWWTIRSGVFVYDSLPKDINFWLSRGARLVLLRHGIGIKKIERAIDAESHRLYKLFHGTPLQRAFWATVLPSHLPVPDLLMACSPIHASQGNWFYGVAPENVRITGFPRHDWLVQSIEPDPTSIPTVGRSIPDTRPVYIYLPTFREGLTRQTFDWDVLGMAAEKADITIAVKLHYVDADRGVIGADHLGDSEHLRMVDPHIDPSRAYPHVDGLITDFSSVPFDFILLGRPIVYYIPDLASFTDQRPLMFDLADVAAGPLCETGAELATALATARDRGIGEYRARYDELLERFHTYPPGGASRRAVDAIVEKFLGVVPPGEEPGRFAYDPAVLEVGGADPSRA